MPLHYSPWWRTQGGIIGKSCQRQRTTPQLILTVPCYPFRCRSIFGARKLFGSFIMREREVAPRLFALTGHLLFLSLSLFSEKGGRIRLGVLLLQGVYSSCLYPLHSACCLFCVSFFFSVGRMNHPASKTDDGGNHERDWKASIIFYRTVLGIRSCKRFLPSLSQGET